VRNLTLIMAVYGQPLMLAKQLETIKGYPDDVLDRLNVIIVDDHGTPPVDARDAEELDLYCKSVKLFRVDTAIEWNQMGARNLAMEHAGGWCLLIDADMLFPAAIMPRMLQAVDKMRKGHVMKWALKHMHGRPNPLDMSSPNTWLIHRSDFFAIGGYDEDYAGHKGWSDVQFHDVVTDCLKVEPRPDLYADFVNPTIINDSAVLSLDRSVTANKRIRMRKVGESKSLGGWKVWAKKQRDKKRLRFLWTQVYSSPK